MRLIDADAMLEYLNLMYDKQDDSDEPYNCAVLGAINYIKHKAPTIDAVSVVRCRECKYAHLTYDGDCKYCDMWKDDDGNCLELYLDGDYYCADGERKE